MNGEREYIGCGVYAEVIGSGILKLSNRLKDRDDVIYLDPLGCVALIHYIESLNVVVPQEK